MPLFSPITGVLLANGTIPLTANWNMGAFSATSTQTAQTAGTLWDGFIAANTTAAALGAQQHGGYFHTIGRGWATTPGTSQIIDWRWGATAIQGAANPSSNWTLDYAVNGGAFTNIFQVASSGNTNITGSTPVLTVTASSNSRSFTFTPSAGAIDGVGTAIHINRSSALAVAVGFSSASHFCVGQAAQASFGNNALIYVGNTETGVPNLMLDKAPSMTADIFDIRSNGSTSGADILAVKPSGFIGVGIAIPLCGFQVALNGALSQPGAGFTGTWIATGGTATTTKPYVLIEPTGVTSTAWSLLGTGLGINAPTGFTGNLIDFQLNGVTRFSVTGSGSGIFLGSVITGTGIRLNATSASLLIGFTSATNYATANVFQTSISGGSMTQISGTNGAVLINPTYNQASGSAANTDLLINRTETALGSGAQKLFDAQVGGSSRFNISNIGLVSTVDNISFLSVGKGLIYKSGTGARAGNATLVGGTVTVTNTSVTANTIIQLTRKTSGGTIGTAITYTLSAGASFTINSDNPLDTSTFTYQLSELN